MNRRQFYRALDRALASGKYRAVEGIEDALRWAPLKKPPWRTSLCPVTLVCHFTEGAYYDSWDYDRACKRLGMDEEYALLIAEAADGFGPHPNVRAALERRHRETA